MSIASVLDLLAPACLMWAGLWKELDDIHMVFTVYKVHVRQFCCTLKTASYVTFLGCKQDVHPLLSISFYQSCCAVSSNASLMMCSCYFYLKLWYACGTLIPCVIQLEMYKLKYKMTAPKVQNMSALQFSFKCSHYILNPVFKKNKTMKFWSPHCSLLHFALKSSQLEVMKPDEKFEIQNVCFFLLLFTHVQWKYT